MIREQYYQGHRLPLRVEIQLAPEGPFAVIVDGDHRDVPIAGESIDDMIEYVTVANRTIYAYARGGQFWHECLTAAPYLVQTHPASACRPSTPRLSSASSPVPSGTGFGPVTSFSCTASASARKTALLAPSRSHAGWNGANARTRSSSAWASIALRRR